MIELKGPKIMDMDKYLRQRTKNMTPHQKRVFKKRYMDYQRFMRAAFAPPRQG